MKSIKKYTFEYPWSKISRSNINKCQQICFVTTLPRNQENWIYCLCKIIVHTNLKYLKNKKLESVF
jgi:hypothetical protein